VTEHQRKLDFDKIGFELEENFCPKSTAKSFIGRDRTNSRWQRILGHMRELALMANSGEILREDSYKNKTDFTEILYPDFYNPKSKRSFAKKLIFDGYKTHDSDQLVIKEHLRSVSDAIRQINQNTREPLKKFKTKREKLYFLRYDPSVEHLVVVGTTDKGATIYAYHSADLPQSLSTLQSNIEWAINHEEIQGIPRKMAHLFYESQMSNIQQELKLNLHTDFIDHDMSDQENLNNL
jgi:hypothetical protein